MKLIREISKQEFYLEYLKSEWYSHRYDGIRELYDINSFNAGNSHDQEIVFLLIQLFRNTILRHIPENTRWYVAQLKKGDFESLTIIREYSWGETMKRYDHGRHGKLIRLGKIAKKIHADNAWCAHFSKFSDSHLVKISEITTSITEGKHDFDQHKLILIKKPSSNVASIIEGNHRALSFSINALMDKKGYIPKEVIVGISKDMDNCHWYNRIQYK